ncbi:ABC transporter permease [Pleionea litopenaei]|uniref:ABC transporter permease n=1 Tax=Pleionea litopenaei TaxID=3070815 RepID=A0AA51X7B3_9GAMM|nr:ABC transporter permease [Pleionea sp. HL-JVS1]WMS86935.1 ABC transporter permease [Pleionea sp. HL-JVS1]
MFKARRFLAIFKTRNLEFWRDRSALSWNLAFPLLLIVGMAVVFDKPNTTELKVGLVDTQEKPSELETIKYTEFVFYQSQQEANNKLSHHQIDLVINPTLKLYYVNQQSSKGYLALGVLSDYLASFEQQQVNGQAIRYVDWVVPGILSMNVMFSSLFGVGYVIVRYRKNGVLKRISATPVSSIEFITAQLLSRFMIVLAISSSIFLITWLSLGFLVEGSLMLLLLILALGTASLVALGLLVAARLQSEELTGGLLNMASWPMMLLSGVWFSLEGAPQWVQSAAQLLPLTHMIDALRAVMIDGAGIQEVAWHLMILTLMTIVFVTLGAKFFSWGSNR